MHMHALRVQKHAGMLNYRAPKKSPIKMMVNLQQLLFTVFPPISRYVDTLGGGQDFEYHFLVYPGMPENSWIIETSR